MIYPRHIAIIMDGNGRWAAKQGKIRLFGHNAGITSVRECCEYASVHGIGYLSLFAFSEENWSRPQDEVDGLMSLMMKCLTDEVGLIVDNNIRFRVIGDRSHLSDSMRSGIENLEEVSASATGTTLLVMLSYSGRWDIWQAAMKLAADAVRLGSVPQMDEAGFASYLSTAGIPDPDLIIRTSGEQRLSNYMLWQAAYSEFYYTPTLWPDFRKKDLDFAVEEFNKRERRYGKVK